VESAAPDAIQPRSCGGPNSTVKEPHYTLLGVRWVPRSSLACLPVTRPEPPGSPHPPPGLLAGVSRAGASWANGVRAIQIIVDRRPPRWHDWQNGISGHFCTFACRNNVPPSCVVCDWSGFLPTTLSRQSATTAVGTETQVSLGASPPLRQLVAAPASLIAFSV